MFDTATLAMNIRLLRRLRRAVARRYGTINNSGLEDPPGGVNLIGINLARASKLFVVLWLLIGFADNAAASDNNPDSSRTQPPQPASGKSPDQTQPSKAVSISSVLYLDALSCETLSEPALPVVTDPIATRAAFPVTITGPTANPTWPGAPQGIKGVPMTPKEKFKLFATKSFKPPWPYVVSAVVGTIEEAIDNNEGRHQDTGDFMADSGSRAARNFTARITANFFEKFAYSLAF
ncbi:MAG TPA: hypothetical protein VFV34_15435, partial [Blastocatellia bacterium]|nr:hypothetical protein [Blastocatellia bacterium]